MRSSRPPQRSGSSPLSDLRTTYRRHCKPPADGDPSSKRDGRGARREVAPRPVPGPPESYLSSSITTSMAAPGFDSTSTVFVS